VDGVPVVGRRHQFAVSSLAIQWGLLRDGDIGHTISSTEGRRLKLLGCKAFLKSVDSDKAEWE